MGESELVSKGPCSGCGSSDACCTYSDGHTFCFSCNKHSQGDAVTEQPKRSRSLIERSNFVPLNARHLSADATKKYGYAVEKFSGSTVQVAPYYDKDGVEVAQKVRFPDKSFTVTGNLKTAGLFGQQLWRTGGKRVVVTEGEIDCLTVAQALGLNWPVVSIPNGAAGAVKAIAAQIEWLESYEQVVLLFDMDEPGRKAAVECAELLSPGKAYIASTPGYKDPNEMWVAGKRRELVNSVWEAKLYRPDGIVNGADLWESLALDKEIEAGTPYPWAGLSRLTHGLRPREVVTLCAGSGIGKSAICAELAYSLLMRGDSVGYIALEENLKRSALRFMGIHVSKPLHLPSVESTPDERKIAFDATLGTGRLFLFDHFGSLDPDNLFSRLRYLVKSCGVQWLVLDHLSIVVSGMDADADERRTIDRTMTRLRAFTEETGVGLILVSHLKRAEGKSHENGGEITLAHLRGSQAIAQLSDFVIGLERDQQNDDELERNTTTIRVLKNRFSGETGVATRLVYDTETGRLVEEAVNAFREEAGGDEGDGGAF